MIRASQGPGTGNLRAAAPSNRVIRHIVQPAEPQRDSAGSCRAQSPEVARRTTLGGMRGTSSKGTVKVFLALLYVGPAFSLFDLFEVKQTGPKYLGST